MRLQQAELHVRAKEDAEGAWAPACFAQTI